MPTPIPFCVYSDGPSLPTGLARIATDLSRRLHAEQDALGISLLQAGWNPLPGLTRPWPVYSLGAIRMDDGADWGARELGLAWADWFGSHASDGVLLSIWDPSRAWSLLRVPGPDYRWGYFPIDGMNSNGGMGGPAGEALQQYDRVLAYGRWGSQVIRRVRAGGSIPYLPHGIDPDVWRMETTVEMLAHAETILQPREGEWILGCVATNQPRKDLGLYFGTLAELRKRGEKVRGWLHTDQLVRAWSIQQLVADFGLAKRVTVTTSLTDVELAACYACCGVTFAPGLGEGFGYPIVESLACGTPVIHGDYGGGAELVPMNAWRVPPHAFRLEGIYGLQRPVFQVVDAANAVLRALEWRRADERVCQEYCRGSVAHLHWDRVWPRWRSWIKQGLEGIRG